MNVRFVTKTGARVLIRIEAERVPTGPAGDQIVLANLAVFFSMAHPEIKDGEVPPFIYLKKSEAEAIAAILMRAAAEI